RRRSMPLVWRRWGNRVAFSVSAIAVAFALLMLETSAGSSIAVQPGPGFAKYIPPPGYVCYRAAKPITIDGKLDDPAWQCAPWTADFVDIEGPAKPKPRFRTRVKMLWDERYLYIGAELEEPHVWGTLTKHDSVIFNDNDFEVFLDANGDNHCYGEVEI